MFIGLPIAVLVAVLTWIFSPRLGVDMRGKISMTALSLGTASAITAGFMYNNIVGVCTMSACFFIVAVLFGYERN
jgi:hypothetical protein